MAHHRHPGGRRSRAWLQGGLVALVAAVACACSFDTSGQVPGVGILPTCDDDEDDDCDNVPNIDDTNPADRHVCGDRDRDGCDDCSSGTFDLYADGPNQDGDILCDLGESCTNSTRLVAVMADGGLAYSDNQGMTWLPSPDSPAAEAIADVAYGLGRFVAVGKHGLIVVSDDGIHWTAAGSATSDDGALPDIDLSAVRHAENGWWAASGQKGTVGLSFDNGATWVVTPEVLERDSELVDLVYDFDNRRWLVSDRRNKTVYSAELSEAPVWIEHDPGAPNSLAGVSARNGSWLATSGDGATQVSGDMGAAWAASAQLVGSWDDVLTGATSRSYLVATTSGADKERQALSRLYRSDDGLSWSELVSLPGAELSSMAYDCGDGHSYLGTGDGRALVYPIGAAAVVSAQVGTAAVTALAANANGSVRTRMLTVEGGECELGLFADGAPDDNGPTFSLDRIDVQPSLVFQPVLFGIQTGANFGLHMRTRLRISAGGLYRFRLQLGSADAARLAVDGEELLRVCYTGSEGADLALAAGVHDLEIFWSDDGWYDQLTLQYAGPDTGGGMITVPPRAFVP